MKKCLEILSNENLTKVKKREYTEIGLKITGYR